jgi:hypothetical protein
VLIGKIEEEKVRVNEMIRARQIRVIDEEGNQLGIMSPADAMREAEERGVDLVEVAGKANKALSHRRRVGAFAPLRYLHDYDYIFRLLLACPGGVRYLHDRVLLHYRIHGGNTLKQGEIVAREQDQALIRRYALLGMTDETSRRRAETALARLAELDSELHAIRGQARWGRLQPLARGAHRLLFPRRSPISKKREGA